MRKYWLLFWMGTIAILSMKADKLITSSVYDWEKIQTKKTSYGEIKEFLKSPTRSLEDFEISAITLVPGKSAPKFIVEIGSDELLIVKEGIADIRINNERKSLEEGSVAIASSGDELNVTNSQAANTVYYSIRFKPYITGSKEQNSSGLFPVFIDWKNVEFKPSANGGRRNIIQQKTSNLKELEIHVTTLKKGLPSHSAHVHPDEEIILVRHGYVDETIKGKPYRLGPGSIIFLTNDDLHGISNAGIGQCEYYAIRWLTAQ